MQPIIERSYLTEVNLGTVSVGRTINFQYIPELQDVTVYGIQVYAGEDQQTSPNGAAVVPNAGLPSIAVTLVVGDDEIVTRQSCFDLRSANVAGFVRTYANQKINLVKSYITLVSVTGISNNQSILFNFIYRR